VPHLFRWRPARESQSWPEHWAEILEGAHDQVTD
jgi:hypothetical protein